MRLKHLQIHGYKTFASKTEFVFPTGVTAIVGPNGSGKSNIVDAIRWVLGEQSFTALRGKRTEDMIFSGSQSRSRAGMAEVMLSLDNSDGWLPIEFSEVTVGRRAYRDGQNEYSINGNRVRLKDISELLSQSGLSRRTYTVVGQGVVDSVLSLRATERRELFEEAAGIAHYRDRREDALRKLDDTKRNLERVQDIIGEIEPRLTRLKRQAERAREHTELSKHLDELLRIWYGYRWSQASIRLSRAQQILNQRNDQHETRLNGLQALSDRIDQIRQAQDNLRGQLGDWHQESNLLHDQAKKTERELAVLIERAHQVALKRQEHTVEISALDTRVTAQTSRVVQAQKKLAAAGEVVNQQQQQVQAIQLSVDAVLTERQDLLKRRQDAQERLSTLRADIAERGSRWQTLGERIETLADQVRTNHLEMDHLNGELAVRTTQLNRVKAQVAHLESEEEQALAALTDLELQHQGTTENLEQQQTNLRLLREKETQVAARFELLTQLRRDYAIYDQAARALLTINKHWRKNVPALSGIKGVLAQLIQVPNSYPRGVVAAVEAALGAYAAAIVVTDWQTAADALRYLRSAGAAGRVTLLALDAFSNPQASSSSAKRDAGTVVLSDFVQCDAALRPLVDRLLRDAHLVPDLETARAKLVELPQDAFCVTPAGELLWSNGAIEGGRSGEKTNPLAQEREWVQLQTRRVELGANREALEQAVDKTKADVEMLQKRIMSVRDELDDLRARKTTGVAVRDQISRRIDHITHEIEWRQSQIDNATSDRSSLSQSRQGLKSEIHTLTQEQTATSGSIQEITAQLADLPVERFNKELTAAQIALASAQQNRQGHQEILRELKVSVDRLVHERKTRHHRVVELRQAEQEVAESSGHLRRDQASLTEQLNALLAKIEPGENQLGVLEEQQKKLEQLERVERTRLRESESHVTNARLELQRREDDLTQLRNRIEEDLGLVELELQPSISGQTPLPLRPLVSKLPIVEQIPEGVQDEIQRIRSQLRRIGGFNPDAPEEYQEALERYRFLQEQSSDLVEASDSLRQIIAEMDVLIEHSFRQTFEAVAYEFSRNFSSLFGGGQARLELTDPDNLAQTGVEIVAQPPSKRLQALASFSGGERALTAVALIFAILMVSPPPFCFLDEVDAMLDEANIGRFRTLLESLTEHTQIVIITHNRGTIPAADTVYGISMGADSVSQAFSIQMERDKIKEV